MKYEKFEEAMEYQDFLVDKLAEHGILLQNYSSKQYQYDKGENRNGIEIKHDMVSLSTGNIYIEIAEKSDPANERYIPSGILREDNTWLYLVGNYEFAYIFSKKLMQKWHYDKRFDPYYKETPTSQGYAIPEKIARNICVRVIYFKLDHESGGSHETQEDIHEGI